MSLKLLKIGPANKLSIFLSASPRDYSSTRQLYVAFLKAVATCHRKTCSKFSFLTLRTTNLGKETCRRKRHLQSSTRHNTQILDYSLEHIEDPQDKAYIANEMRNIISAIAAVSQPLSAIALGRLLDVECSTIRRRLRHLRSVIKASDDENSPIFLFHPSFRDFLFDSRRCASQQFSIVEQEAHKRIAKHCINILSNHLKHDICNVKRFGIRVSEVDISTIQEYLPSEVQYACIYWVQHVLKSGLKFSDDDWVYEFLSRRILYWLEALSWIGRLGDGIHAIIALESSVSVS